MIQNLLSHKSHGCNNNCISMLRTYGPTNHKPLELISHEQDIKKDIKKTKTQFPYSQYMGKPLKYSFSMNCLVFFS